MRLPKQLGLGLLREAESSASDEQNKLFQCERHPRDEILQARKRPSRLAFGNEILHKPLLDALQMHKAHEDRSSVQSGEVVAAVDARQMDFGPHAPRLVEVEPGLIEATKIIDDRHLKLQRIVALQIEALVALHGIRGRMRLREGIARKRLNLPPQLAHQGIGITLGLAVVEETLRDLLKLRLVAHLMSHHAAQHIGIGKVQSRKVMPHLKHILLIDHHAIGLGQQLFQQRMLIVHRLGMMEAMDVFAHHARARHARTDDGAGRH